jgi:hypothetical protein
VRNRSGQRGLEGDGHPLLVYDGPGVDVLVDPVGAVNTLLPMYPLPRLMPMSAFASRISSTVRPWFTAEVVAKGMDKEAQSVPRSSMAARRSTSDVYHFRMR